MQEPVRTEPRRRAEHKEKRFLRDKTCLIFESKSKQVGSNRIRLDRMLSRVPPESGQMQSA